MRSTSDFDSDRESSTLSTTTILCSLRLYGKPAGCDPEKECSSPEVTPNIYEVTNEGM